MYLISSLSPLSLLLRSVATTEHITEDIPHIEVHTSHTGHTGHTMHTSHTWHRHSRKWTLSLLLGTSSHIIVSPLSIIT